MKLPPLLSGSPLIEMEQYRNAILQANKYLGASLLRMGLVTEVELEEGSGKFLGYVREGRYKQASLLRVLMLEMGKLDEVKWLKASDYPLIDLSSFLVKGGEYFGIDIGFYYTTWTVPFEKEEDYLFVATAYNLSEPVVRYWNEASRKKIIWHTATFNGILRHIEGMEREK